MTTRAMKSLNAAITRLHGTAYTEGDVYDLLFGAIGEAANDYDLGKVAAAVGRKGGYGRSYNWCGTADELQRVLDGARLTRVWVVEGGEVRNTYQSDRYNEHPNWRVVRVDFSRRYARHAAARKAFEGVDLLDQWLANAHDKRNGSYVEIFAVCLTTDERGEQVEYCYEREEERTFFVGRSTPVATTYVSERAAARR